MCSEYSDRRLYQYNEYDFDFKFNFYQAVKQHGCTKKVKRRCQFKKLLFSYLITRKLVIRKKLVNNQNLNKTIVFIVLV